MDILYSTDNSRYEIQENNVIYHTVDGEKEKIKVAKEVMISLFPDINEIDRKARICAADELLETKNSSWLEEWEEPVTAKAFMNRLQLVEAEFDIDGITFWYEDDDMFWGHSIMVVCDKNGIAKFSEMM